MRKSNDTTGRKSSARSGGQSDRGLDAISPPHLRQSGIENSTSRNQISRAESTSTVGSRLQQMREEDSLAWEKQKSPNAPEKNVLNDEDHLQEEEVPWINPRDSPTSDSISAKEPNHVLKKGKIRSSDRGGDMNENLVAEESTEIRLGAETRNGANSQVDASGVSIAELCIVNSRSQSPSGHDERQIETAMQEQSANRQTSEGLSAPRANGTLLPSDGNYRPPTQVVTEDLAVAAAVTSNADIEAQVRQNIFEEAVQADLLPEKRPWRRWFALGLVVLVVGVVIGVVLPLATGSGPGSQPTSTTQQTAAPSFSPAPSTFPSLAPSQALFVPITISIRLDDFPTESGWRFRCGDVVYADIAPGTYFVQSQLITETFLVDIGAACQFTMIDRGFASSGICCSSGNGFYRVFLGADTTIKSNLVDEGGDLDGNEEEEVVFLASPLAPTASPAPSVSPSPTLLPTSSPAPTTFAWMPLGQDIDGEARFGGLGESIALALAGDEIVLAAGAPFNSVSGAGGHVRVLKYNPETNNWEALGQVIDGEDASDRFGSSVSLDQDGTMLAVGAPGAPQNLVRPGYARVFHYDATENSWIPIGQRIDGNSSASCCVGDELGNAVSLNSGILAIGASAFNTGRAGYVRVFEYNATTTNWTQLGQDINGDTENDGLSSVSLSVHPNRIVVAIGFSLIEESSGLVRVMEYVSGNDKWIQLGQDIVGEHKGDGSGMSVSLSEDLTLAIGAPKSDETASRSGHVRVFRYTPKTNWTQIGQDIGGEFFGDQSGVSVSLGRNFLAIGARFNFNGGTDAGHARVYEYNNDTDIWTQTGQDIDGEAAGDQSGASVFLSVDASIVGVGAPRSGEFGRVRVFSRI